MILFSAGESDNSEYAGFEILSFLGAIGSTPLVPSNFWLISCEIISLTIFSSSLFAITFSNSSTRRFVCLIFRCWSKSSSSSSTTPSNWYIDKPLYDTLKHFDRVFNVMTKKYADENKININCADRKCFECRTCYTGNSVKVINEIARIKKIRNK